MKLKGSLALVTGASSGIGRAIAVSIAAKGASVALVGRNRSRLAEVEAAIAASGGVSRVFVADLRDETSIADLGSRVLDEWGGIDVIANVAGAWHDESGTYYGRRLADIPPGQISDVLSVGIRAPLLLARLFVPHMIEQKEGKLLNISGTFAGGGSGWLHYYVSKKALESLTVGLAEELREYGVQVNCISPSDVATEALRRFCPKDVAIALDPTDVARLATFLLSDSVADHITGQVIVLKRSRTPWVVGHTAE